jgi:predicted CDP-diglyceride synthetase/phosphatidate cytidylyltransferase
LAPLEKISWPLRGDVELRWFLRYEHFMICFEWYDMLWIFLNVYLHILLHFMHMNKTL